MLRILNLSIMFSKINIQRSLGKGIVLLPFKEKNIKETLKENSLNLTVSKWAWKLTLSDMPQETIESGEALKQQKFEEARYCYIATKDGNGYIVLEPFSTTIVITNEFLAIGNSIGGTIHTRVSTAALGVGHISTMLGPSYMGRLSVPLHNPTNKPICLKVGDQFLSIIFHRLKTRIKESNHTSKSHIEKFTKWGIKLTDEQQKEIYQEDLKDMKVCVAEMNKSEYFRTYKNELSWGYRFQRSVKERIMQNKIILCIAFIVLLGLMFLLKKLFPGFTFLTEMIEFLMKIKPFG